jgi:high-affinity nickel-transport protein
MQVSFPNRSGSALPAAAPLFAGLIAANLAASIWAWVAFHDRPILLGSAFLAWMFGLRHAVDADHIAAIDNVVRKLVQDGRRPRAAGLWFSLGHSTIVVLASLGVAGTARAFQHAMAGWEAIGSLIGTSVSALFLLAIGVANLFILRGTWRSFARARQGNVRKDPGPDSALSGGGPLLWLCRPLLRSIRASWHMYPLGFLFGLGFDTATEIGLLGIAAVQAQRGMSPWLVMVFPALFTAGMALVDTADSVLMTGAYGFALINPMRKLWYNLTMTATSILVAFLIGGLEALAIIGNRLALHGPFWDAVAGTDTLFDYGGIAVIGLFAACWAISALVYKWARYDALA